MDGEDPGAASFKNRLFWSLPGWRFEFTFESRFALIGPLVILQGSDPAS